MRTLEAGKTDASRETDVEDEGAAALYEEASRLALNCDMDGFECVTAGISSEAF